jgi:nitrogen regulatory protein PII
MVKIEAVIRPDKLDNVKTALDEIGIHGITITEVRGAGQQRGYVHHYRGAEYRVNLIEKLKLETVVPDSIVEQAISVIIDSGRTGEVGDGKIFLIPVSDAVRVRTGERGDAAVG